MGVATVAIGFIPSHQVIGVWGALLLCLCRFVQGIGLRGEWSGAVLVATENARLTSGHYMVHFRKWEHQSDSSYAMAYFLL